MDPALPTRAPRAPTFGALAARRSRGGRMLPNKVWFALDCDTKDKAHRDCQGRKGRITVNGTLGTR